MIVCTPGIYNGFAHVHGRRRLTVLWVVLKAKTKTVPQIAALFEQLHGEVTEADIQEALAWAEEHPEEVAADQARGDAALSAALQPSRRRFH